ncbi:MAG: hypothetical protein IPF87_06220 [Gemmatimonadetes bacterium]|nr:hypothetical protein [Gemmatimonadota bacterium]MBP9107422.1 hypothetical protein [Gemmatimonadaceae bacterium]MBK6455660.1 hypothetical protein [Gemmatimonadota bacterium]MBK7835534.1 hypothetical protein [Gemmatimonadota bacterium]MBK8061926.1 hypothetical protein [Gemmatimonadota bacterium]
MHAELVALLQLQTEDDVVDGIVTRIEAIAPRIAALDAARAKAARQLEVTLAQLGEAERKQREVANLVAEHRQRVERNAAQFDLVKNMREATAAEQQVEAGKRMLSEGEAGLRDIEQTVTSIRNAAEAHRAALAEFDATQEEKRAVIDGEKAALDAQLVTARARRESAATQVPASMRSTYDRIRSRRHGKVVFAVTYGACGSCDTSIPVQRGKQMQAKGTIELCEGCGMLLYATE